MPLLGEAEASQDLRVLWQSEVARPAMLSPKDASCCPCYVLEQSDGGWSPASPADWMLPLLMVQ